MSNVTPPKSDELIPRIHFYASVASSINGNAKDIDGIGSKLAAFTVTFEKVRDDVRTASIRNKTLITAAVVVWTLLGGAVTMYVQRGLATFDKASDRIETMEKKIASQEATLDQRKGDTEKLAAITRKYDDIQRRIDEHDWAKK